MHAGGKIYTINTHKFLHCPDKTVSATQSNSVLQVCYLYKALGMPTK